MLSELLQHQAEAIAAQYLPPDTGRPSDIGDVDTLKELFAAIEAGNYLETACELAGLSHVTVSNWKKRGDAGEEPYKRFVTALKRASARAEALAVANVRQAGKLPQFWAAEMTYLERRHPERWGRRQESSDGPRVVVQIGLKDSDIQGLSVQVSTNADQDRALSPPLSADIHSLTPTVDSELGLIRAHSVNPIPPPEALQARDPAEGPTRSPRPGTARRKTSAAKGRAQEKRESPA